MRYVKCPQCGEMLGENVKKCFNCFYDLGAASEEENKKMEQLREQRRIEQEKLRKEQELELQRKRQQDIIQLNNKYEYDVVVVRDTKTGSVDADSLKKKLNDYGKCIPRLQSDGFAKQNGCDAERAEFLTLIYND